MECSQLPTPIPPVKVGGGMPASSSSASTNTNPLEQLVIVQHLAKFLSPKDLPTFKGFRQVCRTWRDASQPKWNHLYGTLTLYLDQSPDNSNKEGLHLDKFRQRYSDPEDNLFKFPYQKYQLCFWDLQPHHFNSEAPSMTSEGPSWFFSTLAPLIKSLSLHHCNSLGTFSIFSGEFLEALPNLKKLKIIGGTISPQALQETKTRYLQEDRDYFMHWSLKSLHFEILLPEEQLIQVWEVFRKSIPVLRKLTIRRLCPVEERQPTGHSGQQLTPFFSKVISSQESDLVELDNLDIVEYTAAKKNYFTVEENPPPNKYFEGIASIPNILTGISAKFFSRWVDEAERNCLELFVCQFSKPMMKFPSLDQLYGLRELHLWGGIYVRWGKVLKKMPNLEVVTWSRTCFGSKVYRERVLGYLRDGGLEREELKGVERKAGGKGWKREVNRRGEGRNLRRLEVGVKFADWEVLRRFGRGISGVREGKLVVQGDEMLRELEDLWGMGLERLEMGHGSGGFSREGLIEVVVEGMGMLKEFRWRGCPCLGKEMEEGDDWREVEERLRDKFKEGNFTVPWRREGECDDLEGICLEKEFKEAVRMRWMEDTVMERTMEME